LSWEIRRQKQKRGQRGGGGKIEGSSTRRFLRLLDGGVLPNKEAYRKVTDQLHSEDSRNREIPGRGSTAHLHSLYKTLEVSQRVVSLKQVRGGGKRRVSKEVSWGYILSKKKERGLIYKTRGWFLST